MSICRLPLLAISLVLLASIKVFGQTNLAENPSFENYATCPNGLSDIAECYWDKAPLHTGSSDYFNACATVAACDVPNNTFGSAFANSGDAYVGGYCGLGVGSTYREYIFDTLAQTLVAGAKYVVSFHYRLASNARFASDDMGFYLSATAPTGTGTGNLGVTPQSHNPVFNYLTSNTAWALYSDTIIAVGNEQYITIGAFRNNPNVILYNTSASIGGAYYYWDDVDVHLLEGIGGDTNICLGESAQVYGIEIDSISWRDSLAPTIELFFGDTLNVTPTQTTTYMAVTPGDTYYFTVNVIAPITDFVGNDTTICEGATVVRSVNLPGYSFEWSTGSFDSVLVTQDSGEFWLEVSLHGCISNDTFHISFYPFPDYDLGPDQTICWYDSTTLDPAVTGGAVTSYNWSNGSNAPTLTVQNTGIYWVDITNVFCTMRDSIEISHHPVVVVDLGPDREFCYSASEELAPNSVNATTFTWSTGTTGNTAVATTTGMYYVTATGNGCNAFDSVHYTFYYDPFFELPETLMYCQEDTVTISTGLDPTGLSFVWNTGQTDPTYQIAGGSQGNFWVQVTGEHCTMRDTVYVGMHPPINLELGDDISLCEGESTVITPNTSSTLNYTWSTGTNTQSITVTSSGVYTLTVSNDFCSEVDKIRVFIYEYPDLDLGDDIVICGPTELNFDVTSQWNAVNFSWYDGTSSPLHTMFAKESQSIWVKATNFICSSFDTLNITLAKPPVINLRNDTILCEKQTAKVRVAGNPAWNYTWSNGDNTQVLITQTGGTYTVTANDGVCSSTDSIIIYDLTDPSVEIFGPEYICLNEIEQLDATIVGAYSYRWQDGSNQSVLDITEPGLYVVNVTHACGVAIDSIFVEDCECFVRFPSAFRPTPSGVNKTFGPEIDCNLNTFELTVFDRWGEVIFFTKDLNERWDGKVKGVDAPVGSYGWFCTYKGLYDGERITRTLQGSVMVLR